jgi:hypothetical protein
MTTIEKRVHPREPLISEIKFECEGNSFLAVTEDISSGGMRIATANPPEVGSPLTITFTLRGTKREVRVHAVVRHVFKNSGVGVQFLDLSPEDLAGLRDYLRSGGAASE